MAEADRKKYWDDGLHLTPAGYDMMGERIAESLIDILSVPAAQARIPSQPTIPMRQTRRPRFSRPVVQEDPLDEELGDASDIQRGYVVVRKRDLD